MKYRCKKCNLDYATYNGLWKHNKKYHKKILNNNTPAITILQNNQSKIYKCNKCYKTLSRIDSLHRHEKTCKKIIDSNNEIIELKEKINELTNSNDGKYIMNNQLINIIMDKNKAIEELKNKPDNNEIIKKEIVESNTIMLNNVIIISRTEDNYINATQLCEAGNKKFNDWFILDTTKDLINELTTNISSPIKSYWIHPDLAIMLAQWISPKFALQISKWIRTLLLNKEYEKKNKTKRPTNSIITRSISKKTTA